jgi:hypothetical protein
VVVGSLDRRGLSWWFDCRTLGVRRSLAMRNRDLEEALWKAKAEAQRGSPLRGGQAFAMAVVLSTLRSPQGERDLLHTVNSGLQRVKVFVNFLRVKRLVDGDPTFKVRRLNFSSVAPEAPTNEAVDQLG